MRAVTLKLYATPMCHFPLPHAHLKGWARHPGASRDASPSAGDRKWAASPLTFDAVHDHTPVLL